MKIKKVFIKHILRKGFLGKDLEHYLRNRLRSVSLAVPKIDLGKNQLSYNFPKYCGL